MATAALPDLFRSLGDPTRLRLLRALATAELSVGELAEALQLAQSGVSRHLAVLRAAGLVSDRRSGTSTLSSVPAEPTDARAADMWPLLRNWLAELPDADEDAASVQRVLAGRASRDFFDEVAPTWDSLRAAQYGDELRSAALLELVPRDLVVLDVGTGTGFMLLGVAGRVARVIGVDASPQMLDQARVNLARAGVAGADLRLGTMDALPLGDAEVDVVTCNMALHHAAQPATALAEMLRVLRPGGRLVLTDLARHPHAWTREELADAWPGFAPDELARALDAAGFADADVRKLGTCHLTRTRTRERHVVDVLLATAVRRPLVADPRPEASPAPPDESAPQRPRRGRAGDPR